MHSFAELKAKHRAVRDEHGFSQNLSIRVHRALSWLDRAEQCSDDDARFVFLWVAFNAAYSTEMSASVDLCEQQKFQEFLKKLDELDTDKLIQAFVWNQFPKAIRVLLNNPYVHNAFWTFQRGEITEEEWRSNLARANNAANHALAKQDTVTVLSIVFARIYILRNQIFHGGATCGGKVNRDQLRDCTNLMGTFVPLMINLMLDSGNTLWGDCVYPVV